MEKQEGYVFRDWLFASSLDLLMTYLSEECVEGYEKDDDFSTEGIKKIRYTVEEEYPAYFDEELGDINWDIPNDNS